MDKQQALQLIGALSNANGVSGFEDEVTEVLQGYLGGVGDIQRDAMCNLYVRRGGGGPVIQLDAHTDEVGFMVQAIRPNGTLSFIPLGGWTPSTLPAHRVRVRTATGAYIPGVVASRPPHFATEADRKAAPVLSEMVIDVGACSAAEAEEEYHIQIGQPVVPDAAFEYDDGHDTLWGKAFDCRLGCAALTATLLALQGEALPCALTAGFSTQEEVGTRGAAVTTAAIRPAAAIVFEGTPADDTFTENWAIQSAIKKGPMLRYADARTITNPRFQQFALQTAKDAGIPAQAAVRTGGATNAAAIHLSGTGVPVIVIGLPVRYIHTHWGLASYADFEHAVQLACAIIRRLDEETISSF